MDALIIEMEKLLASDRNGCDVQDIIGESAGKNIDDLLIEADRIIGETLPYFQTSLNTDKVKNSNDFGSLKANTEVIPTQSKRLRNNTKRVDFNIINDFKNVKIHQKQSKTSTIHEKSATNKYIKGEEIKKNQFCSSSTTNCMVLAFKVPEVNFMKTQLHVSSALLENHNRLQVLCAKHDKYDKLADNMETQEQIDILKMKEELNYYKLKNYELEKTIENKEQQIRDWENQYQQLNQYYCNKFLKKNIEETLKKYERELTKLVERNISRESQLQTIIHNLLEEIDQSHLQYRIKLSKKNKQIRKYLDQIEIILNSVYEFRNNDTKLLQ